MKSIYKSALFILAGATMFASCSKDLDENPVLQTPTTFTLNTPENAGTVVDLSTNPTFTFTWEQPAYGVNTQVEYRMQVSATNKWTISTDDVDNTGSVVANYANMGNATYKLTSDVSGSAVALALQQMMRYEDNAVPASQTVYARTYAILNKDTVYSEPIQFKVKPYYIPLEAAPVETWYLVGDAVKDWGSVIPLLPSSGQTYDTKTGKGIISWTGYISAGGFKVRPNADNWDGQNFGMNGSIDKLALGGSDNISVATPGYYTVTLDTRTDALKVETYTKAVAAPYTTMCIPGSYGAWNPATDGVMTPLGKGGFNHDWTTTITTAKDATGADDGLKFAANGTWNNSWGGDSFPYGNAASGNNIKFKKGTYKVFFNDITGQYSFVKQ